MLTIESWCEERKTDPRKFPKHMIFLDHLKIVRKTGVYESDLDKEKLPCNYEISYIRQGQGNHPPQSARFSMEHDYKKGNLSLQIRALKEIKKNIYSLKDIRGLDHIEEINQTSKINSKILDSLYVRLLTSKYSVADSVPCKLDYKIKYVRQGYAEEKPKNLSFELSFIKQNDIDSRIKILNEINSRLN